MDHSGQIKKALRLCSFFTSVAVLSLSTLAGNACGHGLETAESAEQGEPFVPPVNSCHRQKHTNAADDRFLMLVSTLDGHVTALNGQTGQQQWTVNVGEAQLLSSSISNIQISRNGLLTHLIPSLDGGLYQFDGEAIEPMPLAADILLSSSFRFNDDCMVVGGKEIESYGLDAKSGKVRYICTMTGCRHFEGYSGSEPGTAGQGINDEDTLVISRQTKTIRAVEMQSGAEKWNFSVGQHEVSYIKPSPSREQPKITDQSEHTVPEHLEPDHTMPEHLEPDHAMPEHLQPDHAMPEHLEPDHAMPEHLKPDHTVPEHLEPDHAMPEHLKPDHTVPEHLEPDHAMPEHLKPDHTVPEHFRPEHTESADDRVEDSCHVKVETEYEEGEGVYDFPWMTDQVDPDDVLLKVIVPRGLVLAVSRHNPSQIIWQHKFSTAVAAAWVLQDGEVEEVSLFDTEHNLALSVDDSEYDDEDEDHVDSIPSSPLLYVGMYEGQLYIQPSVQMMGEVHRIAGHSVHHGGVTTQVDMPRVNWKPYLATAASRTPVVTTAANPLLIGWQYGNTPTQDDIDKKAGSLSLWHSEYPYDAGYYLFADVPSIQLPDDENVSSQEALGQLDTVTVSLLNWWREVVAISVLTTILVNLCLHTYYYKKPLPCLDRSSSSSSVAVGVDQEQKDLIHPPPDHSHFTSRYKTDFEQVACLGKGGFGVVFQAKNKLDDCDYAVKRIALNNSDRAKEKVMREVKALAKLEHAGIVRYYQAWFENPPPGWQEAQDKICLDMTFTSTPATTEPSPAQSTQHSTPRAAIPSSFNPLRPDGDPFKLTSGLEDIDETSENANSSGGFVPQFGGSLGLNIPPGNDWSDNDSFGVSFRNSESGFSSQGGVPFKEYHSHASNGDESWDVVFADSGTSESHNDQDSHAIVNISSSGDHTRSKFTHTKSKPSRPTQLSLVKPLPSNSDRSSLSNPTPKLYLYIQMQLCHDECLKDWLCNNTLNRDKHQCLDYFHQILSAVDYVHQCGLMHRDLKPSNIFFSLDGAIKVGDFGLVTADENCDVTPSEQTGGDRERKHTDQVGTELYMSPEQCAGKPYTQKVDVYALGLIFFELFFPFGTQMERTETLLKLKKRIFPARFKKELPEQYNFVSPLLLHNPSQRPTSQELLLNSLLSEYEETQKARLRARTRTLSTSSSGSS